MLGADDANVLRTDGTHVTHVFAAGTDSKASTTQYFDMTADDHDKCEFPAYTEPDASQLAPRRTWFRKEKARTSVPALSLNRTANSADSNADEDQGRDHRRPYRLWHNRMLRNSPEQNLSDRTRSSARGTEQRGRRGLLSLDGQGQGESNDGSRPPVQEGVGESGIRAIWRPRHGSNPLPQQGTDNAQNPREANCPGNHEDQHRKEPWPEFCRSEESDQLPPVAAGKLQPRFSSGAPADLHVHAAVARTGQARSEEGRTRREADDLVEVSGGRAFCNGGSQGREPGTIFQGCETEGRTQDEEGGDRGLGEQDSTDLGRQGGDLRALQGQASVLGDSTGQKAQGHDHDVRCSSPQSPGRRRRALSTNSGKEFESISEALQFSTEQPCSDPGRAVQYAFSEQNCSAPEGSLTAVSTAECALVTLDWSVAELVLEDSYRDTAHVATEIGKHVSNLNLAMQSSGDDKHKRLFIEFCCDHNSELGIEGPRHGATVLRCTVDDGDLSITNGKGMQRIIDTLDAHVGDVSLHGSIPCTSWSQRQYMNISMYGPEFEKRLRQSQKKSLKILRNFMIIANIVVERKGFVSFEWPTGATGWTEPAVERMCKWLGLEVCFEGCAVGVRNRNDQPMRKPFSIVTNNPEIVKEFRNKVCKCQVAHAPCEGSDTVISGHYTKQMASGILRADHKAHVLKNIELHRKQKEKVLTELASAATKEEMKAFLDLSKKDQEKLVEAARKVHANTGHRPPAQLAQLLRAHQAPLASRAAMEQLRCSSCIENGKPDTIPAVSLDISTKPFEVLGIDLKEAEFDKRKYKYLVMVDEASRLTRCVLLFEIGPKEHRNAKTEEIVHAYESHWEELFGNPRVLRHDPEGALCSQEMLEKFGEKGVRLAATAGEAHWQLGIVERMIATIFNAAERIAKENQLPFPQAVSLAVKSQNTVDRVRGYTPSQWAFGKQPSWSDDFKDEETSETHLSRDASLTFQHKLELQAKARAIYEKEQLNQRFLRAARVQQRKDRNFSPGELVYVWRLGGKLSGTKKTGLHNGAWYGPATILGTESKISDAGLVEPGSVIWVVMNDRLWRCSAQQIRRGSDREVAQHTLLQHKPWTFENIMKGLKLGVYTDVSQEPTPQGNADLDETVGQPVIPMEEDSRQVKRKQPEEPLPGIKRRYPTKMPQKANATQIIDWENAKAAAIAALHICEEAFFATAEETPDTVLEMAFPTFDTEKQLRRYLKNPEAFIATSIRKRRVEVNERRLNPEEKEMMRLAKGKEVREFVKEHVVTRLVEGEHVDPKDVMKMRFVLTWKQDPNEPSGKRGKARLVVLGFQDPFLGKEKTSAPTLTKRGKQLLLQLVVQKGWQLQKGDVTAAFLQGRALTKNKYCLAPEELAEALNLPKGERVVRLLKSVYGLTAAPLEWYEQVNKTLTSMGLHRCHTDPAIWTLTDPSSQTVVGIVGAHVDDFLMGGEGDLWSKAMETLMAAFRWTPLERTKFKQCGVKVQQTDSGEIIQDQEDYMATVTEIDIKPARAKEVNLPVTEHERTELRALLGGMQWLVGQTQVDGAVDVNILQSDVVTATVDTLLTANKILRKLKQHMHKLYTKKILGDINFVAWSDASWANRKSGSSTGGYIVGMCGPGVLEGKREHVTIVSWSTNKLKRVARSSLAAEVQALANAEDELHLTRLAWAEMNGANIDLNDVDSVIATVPGTVVIDAKSIYDTLTSTNQPLQLQEKRTALELLAYLQNTEANGTETRWVHGGANIADGLTKVANHPMLKEFLETSTWALVQDPQGLSGKRRKELGLDKLSDDAAAAFLTGERENFQALAWQKLNQTWPNFGHDSDSESE